jgi:hypothetical protein
MWKLKVLVQLVLSIIPGGVFLNTQFHKLKRNSNVYSIEQISERIPELTTSLMKIDEVTPIKDAVIIEIGPGGSMVSGLLMYLLGAKKVHSYDHIKHVSYNLLEQNLEALQVGLETIAQISGISVENLQTRLDIVLKSNSVDEVLSRASISYNAPADATQTELHDASVDIVYSHAVFEHLPPEVIEAFTLESKRILKDMGVVYHMIEVHDHYAYDKTISKVNFLQYSERVWAFFTHNKLSYHNRLRAHQFKDIFESFGAVTLIYKTELESESLAALDTIEINNRFSGMTREELAIHRVEIVFQFR